MNKKRSLKENIVQKRVFLTGLKETHKNWNVMELVPLPTTSKYLFK